MVFDKIKEIIIEQLSVEEDDLTMDTHLMKDLEADSLDAVEIIMAIEDEYGIEIPDEDAEKIQTVQRKYCRTCCWIFCGHDVHKSGTGSDFTKVQSVFCSI